MPAPPTAVVRFAGLLVDFAGDSDAHDSGPCTLEEAFSATQPAAIAEHLYRAILRRAPEPGSQASHGLADGLSPVALARLLLESDEGRGLEERQRSALADDLDRRSLRELWGIPLAGSLGALVADLDAAFVLAACRVGRGRAASSSERTTVGDQLRGGLSREQHLRSIWQEPGTKARLFGPVQRDVRGVLSLVRRPRRFGVFRAHVLATEASVRATILSLYLDAKGAESEVEVKADWQMMAQIREVAAGVRRLNRKVTP